MVGCAVGEGHLDARDGASRSLVAKSLAADCPRQARRLKSKMIVFKEFPRVDRPALSCLRKSGFSRVPSMPMTQLKLDFDNYEGYLSFGLSGTRPRNCAKLFEEVGKRMRAFKSHCHRNNPYVSGSFIHFLAVLAEIEPSIREGDT